MTNILLLGRSFFLLYVKDGDFVMKIFALRLLFSVRNPLVRLRLSFVISLLFILVDERNVVCGCL